MPPISFHSTEPCFICGRNEITISGLPPGAKSKYSFDGCMDVCPRKHEPSLFSIPSGTSAESFSQHARVHDDIRHKRHKACLFCLPVKIRIVIYDLLLVSRFNGKRNPLFAVGNTDQKKVFLNGPRAPEDRTMEPGILRMCKQVYYEAKPVLYSRNILTISDLWDMKSITEDFFLDIPAEFNIGFITSMELRIGTTERDSVYQWVDILNVLGKRATKLRRLVVNWDTFKTNAWELKAGRDWGLAGLFLFMRGLSMQRGLEQLILKGYYPRHWERHLQGQFKAGVVQAIPFRLRR